MKKTPRRLDVGVRVGLHRPALLTMILKVSTGIRVHSWHRKLQWEPSPLLAQKVGVECSTIPLWLTLSAQNSLRRRSARKSHSGRNLSSRRSRIATTRASRQVTRLQQHHPTTTVAKALSTTRRFRKPKNIFSTTHSAGPRHRSAKWCNHSRQQNQVAVKCNSGIGS
jgi:hypothetical protein